MSMKRAILNTIFWIGLALIFNLGIWYFMGIDKATDFFAGYLIEESLSLDNLFLFITIFTAFSIPEAYRKRILMYGIIGAIMMRLVMILVGVQLVEQAGWILYIFGAILVVSGIKILKPEKEGQKDLTKHPIIRMISPIIPFVNRFDGEKFFTLENGKRVATPLFAALLVIESADLIFAVDSIPAVFSVTTDPFIVFTSNIFALLGLRSLYFILERLHSQFTYVKPAIAAILIFTGVKLLLLMAHIHISSIASVGTILSILTVAVVLSIAKAKKQSIS